MFTLRCSRPGQRCRWNWSWAAAHPSQLREALDSNPSYVFFRELPDSDDGPPGTLGAPLTAGYSLAVDSRVVPLGAPVYLATTWPLSTAATARTSRARPVSRFTSTSLAMAQ